MIEINLLPVREARRRADMQQQLLLLGLVVGAAFAACVLVHVAMVASTLSSQTRVTQLNSQIQEFQTQLTQVEDFKKKAGEIEKKLEVIRKLDLSRSGPVRLMDELATRAPQKLWITSLQADGARIQMKGMALDTELIADFLNGLGASPYMKDVELKGTELAEAGGLKLNSFQITAVLTSPEAEAADASTTAAPVPPVTPAPAAAAKKG
jgi:type IV pilus assembly protein PilN